MLHTEGLVSEITYLGGTVISACGCVVYFSENQPLLVSPSQEVPLAQALAGQRSPPQTQSVVRFTIASTEYLSLVGRTK